MLAVRALVSYPTALAQLHVRIRTLVRVLAPGYAGAWCVWVVAGLAGSALLREVLAGEEQHLLVEAADDGDLRLLLLRRRCGT